MKKTAAYVAGAVCALLAGAGPALLVAGDEEAAAAEAPTFYVDAGSVGGPCDDGRAPADAATAGTPWCSLGRAASAAPAGSRVLVRRGAYPKLTVTGGSRSDFVTFQPAPEDAGKVSIAGLDLPETAFLRFEGFTLADSVILGPASNRLEIIANTITPNSVVVKAGTNGAVVAQNLFHVPGTYGVVLARPDADSPPIKDLVIRYNLFDGVGADAIQAKNFDGLQVIGNEIRHIKKRDSKTHSDAFQSYTGGKNLLFAGNYVHDSDGGLLIKDGVVTGLTIVNNVFARIKGVYPTSVYDSPNPVLMNNTYWDNDLGVIFRGKARGVVIANNIFEGLSKESSVDIAYEDFNYIARRGSGGGGRRSGGGSGGSGGGSGGSGGGGGTPTAPTTPTPTTPTPTTPTTPTTTNPLPPPPVLPVPTTTRPPTTTTGSTTTAPTVPIPSVPSLPLPRIPTLSRARAQAEVLAAQASGDANQTFGRGRHDLHDGISFGDNASGDYRLVPGSAGVDAGTSRGASPTDRLEQGRVDFPGIPNLGEGDAPFYDMGAFETQPLVAGGAGDGGGPGQARFLKVTARKRLSSSSSYLRVKVKCSEVCRVVIRATALSGGKRRSVKRVVRGLEAGKTRTIRLSFGGADRRFVRRSVNRRRSTSIQVDSLAFNRAGQTDQIVRSVSVRRR